MTSLRPPRVPVVVNEPLFECGAYALEALRLLRPMNVLGKSLVRLGAEYDGGYVMLDDALEDKLVYSLGIANDVSWDLEMAKRDCQIYQYDHSIEKLPEFHPNFHFERIRIAAKSEPDGVAKSLEDLIRLNGHEAASDIILKMDIEDAEWDVFAALDPALLARFSQILVEMHCFTKVRSPENRMTRTLDCLAKLNATHQVVHIHANNWGWVGFLGGVFIPDTFEVSYVRKAEHQFEPCRHSFPTSIDRPNDRWSPDYYLGAMGME